MAKNCLLLVFLFTCFVSAAQVKLGIIGGPQTASVLEKNSIPNWDSTTGKYYQAKTGLHFGITAEIPFSSSSHFYFQPKCESDK